MRETNTKLEFTDVIDEILLSNETLTKANLSGWIERFPQFEKQLIEFAAFEAIIKYAPDVSGSSSETSEASRFEASWNVVESLIQKQFSGGKENAAESSAIASLKSQAETQGLKFPQLAKATGLSLQLLLSLEQRLVKSASIPRAVIERIAGTLKTSVESVSAYFEQSPQFLSGASYKSSSQPEIGEQREFADLVREDMKLTAEEKKQLLDVD